MQNDVEKIKNMVKALHIVSIKRSFWRNNRQEYSFKILSTMKCSWVIMVSQNKEVQNYFLQNFVSRHQHMKEYDTQSDLTPFLISRVSDMFLHKACVVRPEMSIYDSLKKMQDLKAKVIIIKNGDKYGIVTDTDLRNNVLLGETDIKEEIGTIIPICLSQTQKITSCRKFTTVE